MFLGLRQKAWHPCLLGVFPFICWLFFFFFIYCVHAFEFRARSTTPLIFWEFFLSFVCHFFFCSFILCTCLPKPILHVYQNQCYTWLASSGRLVFRKNSCNFDGVPIRDAISKTTCWDFGPWCWEVKFDT